MAIQNDGPAVLEPESALPEAAQLPAPWQLRAWAYALAVHMPEDVIDTASFVPPSLEGKRRGRMAYVLFADHQAADCGPYQELLVAPAVYDFGEGTYPTITKIYVSNYDCVVNGRRNWGLPNDRADFAIERGRDNVDTIRVSREGRMVAQIRVKPYGLTFPVTSALLPAELRTVMQHWHGRTYRFTLSAKGNLRMAKLIDWSFDPELFPDLARGKVWMAGYFPRFDMTFPAAIVRDR
jgi:hypothetical protein